jgi:hypothetical protein
MDQAKKIINSLQQINNKQRIKFGLENTSLIYLEDYTKFCVDLMLEQLDMSLDTRL